jgi:P2-related tail formation protein
MANSAEIFLRDAVLSDGLPDYLSDLSPEITEAEDFVFGAMMREFLDFLLTDMIYVGVDAAPDNAFGHALLDHEAAEFLLPQYRQSDAFETKRETIKNADLFWSKAGTVGATKKIVEIFFGAGALEEWFEYGGLPHFFRVRVDAAPPQWARILEFLKVCDNFKRLSAHLEKLRFILSRAVGLTFAARRTDNYTEIHSTPPAGVKLIFAARRVEYGREKHEIQSGIVGLAVYDWAQADTRTRRATSKTSRASPRTRILTEFLRSDTDERATFGTGSGGFCADGPHGAVLHQKQAELCDKSAD